MGKMTVLFIVAHPDDEALGAGGTINAITESGGNVVVLTLSGHSATRHDELTTKQKKSSEILGVSKNYCMDIETMEFSNIDRYLATQKIEEIIKKEKPDTIFTHYIGDIHNDHRITAQLVLEASKLPFRQTGYNHPIKGIYMMEVPSSTDWGDRKFYPTAFKEVTIENLKRKVEAFSVYEGVNREVPHPRNFESIVSLARYRGGQCGKKYAEAFMANYIEL